MLNDVLQLANVTRVVAADAFPSDRWNAGSRAREPVPVGLLDFPQACSTMVLCVPPMINPARGDAAVVPVNWSCGARVLPLIDPMASLRWLAKTRIAVFLHRSPDSGT